MGSDLNFKDFGNDPPPAGGRFPGAFPLARQHSVYSLTFDEFQTAVGGAGKDLGSMNMDELLKSIWSADDNHNSVSSRGGPQVGSITLPRTISQKTVDEVWKDMSKEYKGENDSNGHVSSFGVPHRQPTLGETTLEEFLARAGVVREEPNNNNSNNNNNNNVGLVGDFWHPVMTISNSNVGSALNVNGVKPLASMYGSQMGMRGGMSNNNCMVQNAAANYSSDGLTTSNGDLSPVPYVFNGGVRGRKSVALEKVVERRQRRMIKNRESAARSRARKQAYTTELEEEVARLKEEHEELQKKQAHILEMQKNQVLEMMKQQIGGKRQCLRRTQTGPW